ncbi:hypothetical protein ANN_03288 [Periplaneta americana]|uniref:Serpin domain-containing protein n=1 Tax=Periplaneta americana TaxID=6978 RepID=A0ABQ8TYL2_PERAM|nr:hypothetical protein ANN_03288 [Periplaneta americana]
MNCMGYVDSEENLAFSPLGFSVLLAILKEGAQGETRNQLVNALHLPDDPAVTRAAYKSVLERFREKNLENHPEFRNWFYIYKNFTVDPEYRLILQENYLTEVKDVDRLDKEAVKEEAESMKNTEIAQNADATTLSPDSMSEESEDLEKLEESPAPANVEEIMEPEKGDKTEESGETEEIMQLSDEDASNSKKDGPLKFSIPIPFPEKLKLRKMHDEREASPSGEVMTMQEEMLGNKKDEKVQEIKNDKMENEKKEEMMEEKEDDKKEGEKKDVVMEDGKKDEKTEEIEDDKMEDDKKGEKMDDGKKKEIIKEIVDEMKSLRDKLQAESNEEKYKKEKNEEPSKDDVTMEKMKDDKIEEIKDDKMGEIKDDKMEEIKNDKTEEKKDEMEEMKGDKMEEKNDDKLEEKKEDKMEEKKDDKMEEMKDDKIEEMKDDKMEEMKDDKKEMKDDKIEKKKIDKIEEIKEDKMEGMKDDKMEAMKDDKKEEVSKDETKDCDMMGSKPEDMMDKMKEKESMMNDKKDEAIIENKDEEKDSTMENKDKKDEDIMPGVMMEEDMKVDPMKEEALISQAMKEDEKAMEAEKRKGRHLELPRISRGTLQSNDVTSSLSGNNLVRKDTRSEAVSQMLVFNGLYFKGTWETPFIGQREDSFYKSDTEKSTVTMMNTQGNFRVGNIPDLDSVAIELPYKGKRYALMIVMPNSRTGLRQLAAEMTNYPLRDIQKHLHYQDVAVCIPSFEVESTTKPIQALNKVRLLSSMSSKC